MKQLLMSVAMVILGLGGLALSADTMPESVWLKDGSGTWKDATRWKDGQIPQAGSIVRIPKDTTATVLDVDAPYLTQVAQIARADATSWLEITNESELTLSARCYVGVRKLGAGELKVDHNQNIHHLIYQLDVQAGTVSMIDSVTGVSTDTSLSFGPINIAAGCEVKMAASRDCKITGGLSGAGTISCTAAKTLYLDGGGSVEAATRRQQAAEFSGTITTLKLYLQNCAGQKVADAASMKSQKSVTVSNAYLGFADVPGEFALRVSGSELEYLGSAESLSTKIYLVNGARTGIYNAGPLGGTAWSINTYHLDNDMIVLELTGDNAATTVLNGTLPFENRAYAAYVKKTGSGTWKIGDKSYGNHGVYDIRKGTLEYAQLAEKGGQSALGTATICHSEYNGTRDDTKAVDYSLVLGDGTTTVASDTATLKYVGTEAMTITGRQVVVKGAGRFVAEGAALDWTGFKSFGAGENTLILGGAAANNQARGVANGSGTMSLLKEGAGDWSVHYPATSGDVAVKAGRLDLKTNPQYRWYKIVIKELYSSSQTGTIISHFGFFNQDGVEQGTTMTYNSACDKRPDLLQPGECCAGAATAIESGYSLTKVVQPIQYNVNTRFGHSPACTMVESDSNTWAEVVFRLPEDADPVVKYDIAAGWFGSGAPFARTPTAWAVYGSVDGSKWDLLDEKSSYTANDGYIYWMSDLSLAATNNDTLSPNPNPDGFAVAPCSAKVALPTLRSVAVAAGATLATDYPTLTVNRLNYDVSEGAGTLNGFTFGATGTLNLAADFAGGTLTIPYVFTDCEGTENLQDWSIAVSGVAHPNWKLESTGTGLRIVKPGLYLIFK